VVSDNSGHVCGVSGLRTGRFSVLYRKSEFRPGQQYLGRRIFEILPGAGEILKIHRHALWEIPPGVDYEEAAVLDPICNAYKSLAQQSKFFPVRTWWFSVPVH
jgi:threonine dehydrogenase-like Zn-dependent dehydrogenase